MILPCWEKVLALGYREEDGAEERKGVPVSQQKQARLQRSGSLKQEPPEGETEVADPLNYNWSSMSQMTIPFLQTHVLPALEPSVLSAANLRSQEKVLGKSELMELLEFLTGLADWPLSGPHRSKSGLLKFLKERYASRARRGGLLVLPPIWEQQGLYIIDGITDMQCTVRCQYSSNTAVVALSKQHVGFSEQVYVDMNFSEARAALRVRGMPSIPEIALQTLFGTVEFVTPEGHKTKMGRASPLEEPSSGSGVVGVESKVKVEKTPVGAEAAVELSADELQAVLFKMEGADDKLAEGDLALHDESLLVVPPPPPNL
eukprot:6492509-Amphidinium_carterae.1